MKEIFKKIKTGSLIITISIVLVVVSVVSLVSFNYIYSIKYNDEISESIDTIEDIFTLMGEDVDVEYQPLNRTINIYAASPVLGDYSFNAFSKMIKKDINLYQSLVSLEDIMSSDGYEIIESIIKEELNYINIKIIYYYEEIDNELFVIKNGDIKYSIIE